MTGKERISLEKDDRAAALVAFMVDQIGRIFPTRSVGRSLLQKLFYILSRDDNVDAFFELFINGPYSDWVESALNQAAESGMLTTVKENGRSIISARGGIAGHVMPNLKEKVNRCVHAYGFYGEEDLAILTTVIFLEDHGSFGPDELIKAVGTMNPRFDMRRVLSLVDHTDVVYRSW